MLPTPDASKTPLPLPPPPPPPAGSAWSREQQAATQARLDRLAQRRASAAETPTRPAGRSGRRHPAASARLAALGLSLASTTGLTAYFLRTATAAPLQPATVVVAPSTGSSPSSGSPSAAPTESTASATQVVDGAVYQNRWGNVQVEATFDASGSLVAVDAIQTPDDRSKSVWINDQAVPRLDAEALQLQSANIHTVSGATYTSTDYRRSLQSAIDAARDAQLTNLS